ncbi:M15 family metallopeptidase [Clostridium ganghwense]|uniref:M15 family metallopeptidase n=1 Tax=Clostridium ganghwense TaxID=312089 RepID=A0ABT4CQ52_9CLOT|nr:M15 family metallopeptidase [Clostridium ganghwense]MCY6371198.1 M15 family metallopeptidase [Clostridium ganghwense]
MKTLTLTKNDIYTGNLVLVNAKLPLVSHSNNGLIFADAKRSDILMERGAATALSRILCDMNCIEEIVLVSGYRSEDEQEHIYSCSMRDNGKRFTEKYVALPNHSEHQTGFAIDLGLKKDDIDFIRPDFPYEGICNEFRKKAPKYGFIERYQSGKEDVTGIAHEPWHFRYVGYPHSEIMSKYDFSLEEYIEFIKNYTYGEEHLKITRNKQEIEIFYVPFLSSEQMTLHLPEHSFYQVSGNNEDGFIITQWREQ